MFCEMFRKILNFCLNEPARSAAGRITDGARKTLGVSSPCLLDCLWLYKLQFNIKCNLKHFEKLLNCP